MKQTNAINPINTQVTRNTPKKRQKGLAEATTIDTDGMILTASHPTTQIFDIRNNDHLQLDIPKKIGAKNTF